MKCYIIDTLIGIFAIDDGGNILNFRLFDEEGDKLSEFYESLENDSIPEIYGKFLEELKSSGFSEFIFDNEKLETLTTFNFEAQTGLEPTSLEFQSFRSNLLNQMRNIGINTTFESLKQKYKHRSELLIKREIREVGAKTDKIIIHVSETLETLKKSLSLFSSRLKEWYGLHFPELIDKIIDDNIVLAKLVVELGHRKNFTFENLQESFQFGNKLIQKLHRQAEESMGSNIDLEIVKSYANEILSINEYRERLELYLEDLMEQTAPNINALVGSLIGAKLIAQAGSLKKLAYMPASRIQVLGAETALYRFLKGGGKPPKHGLIFQYSKIRGNPPWIRGNIARLIAGKLALAAKVDYFGGDFIGDKYSQEVDKKIEEIKEKYPNPPKKKS
ncbi:MAG: putative NOP5 family protein [Promethearchaeota archaeon]|nr:MAG: putative NOP5 family protein [Candidatus Lokiarchaeota archaeon]